MSRPRWTPRHLSRLHWPTTYSASSSLTPAVVHPPARLPARSSARDILFLGPHTPLLFGLP
jgi:hypothetical protein